VRSMATLVVAVLAAGSITADAHHGRKQGPANHGRQSFAWNLHRQASVAHHGKASSVSVEQDVKTRPLQPITDFLKRAWRPSGQAVGPVTENVCTPLIWCAHTEPFHWARSSMSLNERTKRSILVTVRDRGPYKRGRILDLTPGAASALGFDQHAGVARVMLNIVGPRRSPERDTFTP
jgi:hypothetical protein